MKVKIEGIDETLEKMAHVSELLREVRDIEDIDEALEKIACANTLLREIKPIACLCELEFKAESENDLFDSQSTEMFKNFRQSVKCHLKSSRLTYAQLSQKTGIAESTIKCFMCGESDSRRVAEKIANALNCALQYEKVKSRLIRSGTAGESIKASFGNTWARSGTSKMDKPRRAKKYRPARARERQTKMLQVKYTMERGVCQVTRFTKYTRDPSPHYRRVY